ncbi:glycosyltransferase family 4 protein [Mariprofundus ferrooxydans]|uniref:glycosyltransferase family 4 protein n=1 Tax=Mariprofundus ferrooxydans TaxID=314344 RepID=UPI00143153D8|nr:glycosyltransferase family 4 protein [Mariprofundus ferrooxydans]
MKILLVAMTDSMHTARWISQINEQGWDVRVFSSIAFSHIANDLDASTIYNPLFSQRNMAKNKKVIGLNVRNRKLFDIIKSIVSDYMHNISLKSLIRVIKSFQPDIIHSLEIQNAGYLTLDAKQRMDSFPPWIVTNWGSDLYLFGRLPEHRSRIEAVLSECDYYSCECIRDVGLAQKYGFTGQVMDVMPNTGGFDLARLSSLRQPGEISDRKVIMLKGYQGWAGRAQVGLRALARCSEILDGYEVVIYSPDYATSLSAQLFTQDTGVPVTLLPCGTSHEEILKYHGKARISIGLSISDAISTSFLEAIAMGSFPIQSWTSCANEWCDDGVNCILVPPEDPDVVELAIRRALSDDDLVNNAAMDNAVTVKERLDSNLLKQKTISFYNKVATENGI